MLYLLLAANEISHFSPHNIRPRVNVDLRSLKLLEMSKEKLHVHAHETASEQTSILLELSTGSSVSRAVLNIYLCLYYLSRFMHHRCSSIWPTCAKMNLMVF